MAWTKSKIQLSRTREMALQEKIEKEREYLVVKSNALAQDVYPYDVNTTASGPLNEQQNKLVSYLCSQIKPGDESLPTFTISLKSFALVCGIDPSGGSYYNNVKKNIEKLMHKTVEMRSKDGQRELLLHYIVSAEFDRSSKTVQIIMDPRLTRYLIGLKGNFFSYEFRRIGKLSGKWTIPIYELLKSRCFESSNGVWEDIDDLKERLCCKTYNISNFVENVIRRSCDEINKYTELRVSFDLVKEGRKYKWVCFDITDLSRSDREEDHQEMYRRNQNLDFEYDQLCLFSA